MQCAVGLIGLDAFRACVSTDRGSAGETGLRVLAIPRDKCGIGKTATSAVGRVDFWCMLVRPVSSKRGY